MRLFLPTLILAVGAAAVAAEPARNHAPG